MEPLEGPTPPANAKDGQHWFDTTSNQMKVYIYAVKRWQRVIRVFAAKLAQGGVFVSMSRQSPSFVGTQVGLNIPTSSGAITTDVPTSGFVAPVGIAISATQLAINIGSPIQLASQSLLRN